MTEIIIDIYDKTRSAPVNRFSEKTLELGVSNEMSLFSCEACIVFDTRPIEFFLVELGTDLSILFN